MIKRSYLTFSPLLIFLSLIQLDQVRKSTPDLYTNLLKDIDTTTLMIPHPIFTYRIESRQTNRDIIYFSHIYIYIYKRNINNLLILEEGRSYSMCKNVRAKVVRTNPQITLVNGSHVFLLTPTFEITIFVAYHSSSLWIHVSICYQIFPHI